MLDLLAFFKSLSGIPHCVVKMSSSFPRYRQGEDIDIFCYSVSDLTAKILAWAKGYVQEGYSVKVSNVHKKKHVHVDLYLESALEFRFDLYGELPVFQKLSVKPALFESVIEHAVCVSFAGESGGGEVPVPSRVDDLLIRYLEFMEWYDARPDKIKHLDFIMNSGDEPTREKLLQKLHHYTKLPPIFVPHECPFCRLTGRLKKYLPG